VCPGLSLADFFRAEQGTPQSATIRGLLELIPPYLSQSVVLPDTPLAPVSGKGSATANSKPVPGTAVIAFGIKVMPFDEQERLIGDIRSEVGTAGAPGGPPAGASATVVGLPVLAADANSALSGSRYLV